jgi:membrane protease YdiL (CAAX protease family)
MLLESMVLAIPLLVLAQAIARIGGGFHLAADLSAVATPASIPTGLASRFVVSIGAGLYEEFLFRMLVIALLHTLLVDVARADHWVGIGVAVVVSAALFTAAHPLNDAAGALSTQRVVFYLMAGLYFAAVYVARGFGIAVATHAAYDIATYLFIMKS